LKYFRKKKSNHFSRKSKPLKTVQIKKEKIDIEEANYSCIDLSSLASEGSEADCRKKTPPKTLQIKKSPKIIETDSRQRAEKRQRDFSVHSESSCILTNSSESKNNYCVTKIVAKKEQTTLDSYFKSRNDVENEDLSRKSFVPTPTKRFKQTIDKENQLLSNSWDHVKQSIKYPNLYFF